MNGGGGAQAAGWRGGSDVNLLGLLVGVFFCLFALLCLLDA